MSMAPTRPPWLLRLAGLELGVPLALLLTALASGLDSVAAVRLIYYAALCTGLLFLGTLNTMLNRGISLIPLALLWALLVAVSLPFALVEPLGTGPAIAIAACHAAAVTAIGPWVVGWLMLIGVAQFAALNAYVNGWPLALLVELEYQLPLAVWLMAVLLILAWKGLLGMVAHRRASLARAPAPAPAESAIATAAPDTRPEPTES